MKNIFKDVSANLENSKWNNIIKREKSLYQRDSEMRSEFERDYTRIINSRGYRRLKHKTQVFFSPENDHICTRIEHVTLVESISYTIAKYLGLNTELTKAIATAHDIGHSPFGHQGEKILSEISEKEIGKKFWHERNGLEFVDKIELLETPSGNFQNLDLTYAVRDGIISHCGEIDERSIKPRNEFINLDEYQKPNQYSPYTWEGCVVKLADKISYLGRDILDAITLGILDNELSDLYDVFKLEKNQKINNTFILNTFINDLCQNSSLENGLCFSDEKFEMINYLKKFNYKNIYFAPKLICSIDYFKLVLTKIYEFLKSIRTDKTGARKICSYLVDDFESWLNNYSNICRSRYNENDIIFDMRSEKDYIQAIIYYIAGMTDNYAMEMYNKIISF